MRPNRKADLQRKLTLAAIPTPPAGLAQRIKTDIPKHFPDSTAERQRLGSAVAFNMRVAASILLLVGSLFVALHILNRAVVEDERHMGEFSRALDGNKAPGRAFSPVPKLQQNAGQVVTSTEEAPAAVAPPERKTKKADVQLADAKLRQDREKDEAANGPARDLASLDKQHGEVARITPAPAPLPSEPAPPPPASAAAEETAKAVVAQAPAVSEKLTVTSGYAVSAAGARAAPKTAAGSSVAAKTRAVDFLASAQGSDLAPGAPSGMFGYSLDYSKERRQLEGVIPLVQHFAAPTEWPKHGVRLEADAAPSPLDPSKDVLRISIDTAANPSRSAATPASVAADARIEIAINPEAVVSHRAVTGEPSPRERLLVEGMSMTAVYEFQLAPSISPRAHLATVRLHYRSMPDGREQVLEQNIRVGDIAGSWSAAPQRTKSASLAAAFGETRARGRDTSAIAEKARAIGLDELADLAKPR
jgi:hypothetical protein